MSNLLSGLEEASKKTRYQSFLIEMGIEKVTVLIPLSEAMQFETEVSRVQPNNKRKLLSFVEKYNGQVGS